MGRKPNAQKAAEAKEAEDRSARLVAKQQELEAQQAAREMVVGELSSAINEALEGDQGAPGIEMSPEAIDVLPASEEPAKKKRGRPPKATQQLLGGGINDDRLKDLDEAGEEYVGAIAAWKEASEHVVEKKKQVDALMKKHSRSTYRLTALDPVREIFYKPAKDATVAIRKVKDSAEIHHVGGDNDDDAEEADESAREAAGESPSGADWH